MDPIKSNRRRILTVQDADIQEVAETSLGCRVWKLDGTWHTFAWAFRVFGKFLNTYKLNRVKADLVEMLTDALTAEQEMLVCIVSSLQRAK